MNENRVSFVNIFGSLGLLKPENTAIFPKDTSIEAIAAKITNPTIARELGVSPATVAAVNGVEIAANLLDSYSETGDPHFIMLAEESYNDALAGLSPKHRQIVVVSSMAAITYFHYERKIAERIKRGDHCFFNGKE